MEEGAIVILGRGEITCVKDVYAMEVALVVEVLEGGG